MAGRRTQPPPAARDLKAWLKDEYNNEAKYLANLQLAKAVAMFVGSVIVMRNFGDAFAI